MGLAENLRKQIHALRPDEPVEQIQSVEELETQSLAPRRYTLLLFGTFVFYWWHRVRHLPGFWVVFHQVHHSPARIEALTAFYKHPVEILTDSALAAVITTARKLA